MTRQYYGNQIVDAAIRAFKDKPYTIGDLLAWISVKKLLNQEIQ